MHNHRNEGGIMYYDDWGLITFNGNELSIKDGMQAQQF